MAGSTTSHKQFATTHWTMVLAAEAGYAGIGAAGVGTTVPDLLVSAVCLCAAQRPRAQDAEEDLTQAFLARLLEKNVVAAAKRERGKFRSFLLASLNHFLSDEWDKARAKKRGNLRVISLDGLSAESRYVAQPQDHATPEKVFQRQWALRVLDQVLQKLEGEFAATGKGELFKQIRFCLAGERSAIPYAQLAQKVGMTEGAVTVAVHRLRQRYRAVLREEIAQTIAAPEDVEEELRDLFRALSD